VKEIRLCWTAVRTTRIDGEIGECGSWCPDTDSSRKELSEILEAGNQVSGDGSHWIQERELETL
jgi:hypothetical protein